MARNGLPAPLAAHTAADSQAEPLENGASALVPSGTLFCLRWCTRTPRHAWGERCRKHIDERFPLTRRGAVVLDIPVLLVLQEQGK